MGSSNRHRRRATPHSVSSFSLSDLGVDVELGLEMGQEKGKVSSKAFGRAYWRARGHPERLHLGIISSVTTRAGAVVLATAPVAQP